jgi:RNA polymerase sigma-70 factor (ECF subfamily)
VNGAPSTATAAAEGFEPYHRRLRGLAYRMLGSVADAEDVVQDAFLRWYATDRAAVGDAGAYLSRVVTRLCLDRLKSARARRETYVGSWLPEPVLDADAFGAGDAEDAALDLSVALMLALERLSPLERAAFLLHDVFDASFDEVATALGRTPASCRQLAARARRNVRAERPRFPVTPEEGQRIARAFRAAADSGDASVLSGLLAQTVVLTADGGGRVSAVRTPLVGRDAVARFFSRLARVPGGPGIVREARINGLPGFVTRYADGTLQTTAFEIEAGLIVAIHVVRNPDKLTHVPPP